MNLDYSKLYSCILIILCLHGVQVNAQQNKTDAALYTVGHATAFVGGLYDAYYPYSKLKQHGDFGLGAPDKLDGELVMLNGKIYQTKYTGKTFEINYTGLTPFAVVNFFDAEKVVEITAPMTKEKLYAYLDSLLPGQNDIYALRIHGVFNTVKTRAFPPVTNKPYLPLASMLSLQRFFTFNHMRGDLVGYRIPAYMEGPNISGYHFHFLTDDTKGGGHLIDLLTDKVIIEIERLNSFTVDLPHTKDFENFDFKKDRREEVKKVENQQKN